MPDFGYKTAGISYTSIWDIIRGSVFTIPEDGTADSVTAYLRLSGTTFRKAKCAIYKHSDLSLVGATQERTDIPTQTADWYTFNFSDPKPSLTANTEYIIVVWGDVSGGVQYARLYYDAGDADQGHYQSVSYNSFPNPLVPTHDNNKYSIYCTYTTGGVLKEVTDSLSLSDALLCNKTLAVTDTVGLADSSLKDWTTQITDTITVADSISRDKRFSIGETVSLSESVSVLTEVIKQVTDSIALTEQALTHKTLNITDAASLMEQVATDRRFAVTDQVELAESVYVNKILFISDQISLVETVEKGVAGAAKTRIFLIMGDLAIQLTG